ncbi:MAG: hypothetical protein E3J64_06300 [Anaerolineales bacterium]|nr:MAG: hypothetical protein E3J64_06300 [Anaerolineales bacterium]
MNVQHVLRQELRYHWRSRRLLTVVAVLAAFGMLSPLLARYTAEIIRAMPNGEQIAALIPEPTIADAVSQYLKNVGQFGVILALLLSMGAVTQEKERGTAALVLVKPVGRGEFICAKFAALCLTFAAAILLAGLGCYYYALVLFEPLDAGAWVALNGLLLVFLMVHVALTLLFSTIARSQVMAGGLASGLTILLAVAASLPTVGEFLPGQLLAWGERMAVGSESAAWPALGVSAAIIGAALAGAVVIFRKQEL